LSLIALTITGSVTPRYRNSEDRYGPDKTKRNRGHPVVGKASCRAAGGDLAARVVMPAASCGPAPALPIVIGDRESRRAVG
jgi:hypothetical protein